MLVYCQYLPDLVIWVGFGAAVRFNTQLKIWDFVIVVFTLLHSCRIVTWYWFRQVLLYRMAYIDRVLYIHRLYCPCYWSLPGPLLLPIASCLLPIDCPWCTYAHAMGRARDKCPRRLIYLERSSGLGPGPGPWHGHTYTYTYIYIYIDIFLHIYIYYIYIYVHQGQSIGKRQKARGKRQ